MLNAVVVFFAAFVVDIIWALYIRRVNSGAAAQAGLYAGLVFLVGAFNTLSYLEQPWLLGPIAVGAGLGTWAIVRWEHRAGRVVEGERDRQSVESV